MKYKMPFNQYKQCQKMTKNQFDRWLETFASQMWQQGYNKACEDVPDGSVVIDTTDTMIIDTDYDELYNKILSVKGVGPALCERILDKLYEEYDGYISTIPEVPE